MIISDVRVYLVNFESSSKKANVSITLDGEFVVGGLAVVEGKNGAFVKMPSYKANDGTYKDTCFPLSKELREEIQTKVLMEYQNKVESTGQSTANVDIELIDDDELPF